jgi:hypothetical protein
VPRGLDAPEVVALDPETLDAAHARVALLAGPVARKHLELMGYRLRRVSDAPRWSMVVGRLHCATLQTTSWSPLPGLEYSGHFGVEIPPAVGAEVVFIMGASGPISPRAATADGVPLPLTIDALQSGPGGDRPPPDFWLEFGHPGAALLNVVRVRVPSSLGPARLVSLIPGRRAPRMLGRLVGYPGDARARICAAPLPVEDVFSGGEREAEVDLEQADLLGVGWYGIDRSAAHPFRWTGAEAVALVPSARVGPILVRVEAMPPDQADPLDVALAVNGEPLGARRMSRGFRVYEWQVPSALWLAATNELRLSASATARRVDRGASGTRELGLAVRRVSLTRLD